MKKRKNKIEDAVLMDEKIWFCISCCESLFSMDIVSKEKKSFRIPSGGAYVKERAFGSMRAVGRKIYLIPFYERVIMQFDVDTETFCRIEIDSSMIENKTALFLGTGVYQNYLFIMGLDVPVILRLNTENHQIDYITDWNQKVENLIFDSSDVYFRKQSVVLDNRLYVPFCNANAVLEVDCISLKTTIHCMGEEKQGYSGICFEGSFFWLSPRKNGSIVRWNFNTEQISKIDLGGMKNREDSLSYIGIITLDSEIALLPLVEKKRGSRKENVFELCGSYVFVQEDEKSILFFDRNTEILTLIDKENSKKTELEVGTIPVDIGSLLQEKGDILREETVSIQQFIELITHGK